MEQSNSHIIPQEAQNVLNKYSIDKNDSNDNSRYKSPVYAYYAQYIEALCQANNTTSTTSNTLNSKAAQDGISQHENSTIESEARVLDVNEWKAIRDSQQFSNLSLCDNNKNSIQIILIPYPCFSTIYPESYPLTNYMARIEQQENNALIDLVYLQEHNNNKHGNWLYINAGYNNQNLQDSFVNLLRDYYSIKAIKRLIIQTQQNHFLDSTFYDKIIKTETQLEKDYQFIFNEISERKAKNIASNLSGIANKLLSNGYDIFDFDNSIVNRTVMQILGCTTPHESCNSLLDSIITNSGNQYQKPEDAIYNTDTYFKKPRSVDDILGSCNISNNKTFNNLLHSCYIWLVLSYIKASAKEGCNFNINKLRIRSYYLYKQAFICYLESYNFMPANICLNRDLTNIAQNALDQLLNTADSTNNINLAKINFEVNQKLSLDLDINPHHDADICIKTHEGEIKPFQSNCSACVTAYELFRKGWYRVAALPNLKQNFPDNLVFHLSHHTNLVWKNNITGAAPDVLKINNIDQIKNICFKGERYHLSYTPNEPGRALGIGHVLVFELDKEGNISIYNPQYAGAKNVRKLVILGKTDKSTDKRDWFYYLEQSEPLFYYRVDNCTPIIRYAEKIVTPYENMKDPNHIKDFLHSLDKVPHREPKH